MCQGYYRRGPEASQRSPPRLANRRLRRNFVTPNQKHNGKDTEISPNERARVYEAARAQNPKRWIKGNTRNWDPVVSTALVPVNNDPKGAAARSSHSTLQPTHSPGTLTATEAAVDPGLRNDIVNHDLGARNEKRRPDWIASETYCLTHSFPNEPRKDYPTRTISHRSKMRSTHFTIGEVSAQTSGSNRTLPPNATPKSFGCHLPPRQVSMQTRVTNPSW